MKSGADLPYVVCSQGCVALVLFTMITHFEVWALPTDRMYSYFWGLAYQEAIYNLAAKTFSDVLNNCIFFFLLGLNYYLVCSAEQK